jgi:hypothetical protein
MAAVLALVIFLGAISFAGNASLGSLVIALAAIGLLVLVFKKGIMAFHIARGSKIHRQNYKLRTDLTYYEKRNRADHKKDIERAAEKLM